MLKSKLILFALPLLLLFCNSSQNSVAGSKQKSPDSQGGATGTLQKMIVESGSVTMDLDLNRLNGSSSLVARPAKLQFAIGANSFFPILVFNNLLRGPQPGSMALIPQNSVAGVAAVAGIGDAGVSAPSYSYLPAALTASLKQLVIEKLPSDKRYDL